METTIIGINDISPEFINKNKFLLDANILMILFGHSNSHNDIDNDYSHLIQMILENGGTMVITYDTLSEFIHAYQINAFKKYKKYKEHLKHLDFKSYRHEEDFLKTISYLSGVIESEKFNHFFKVKKRLPFSGDIDDIILNTKYMEPRDSLLLFESHLNNYSIVTNDKDFLTKTIYGLEKKINVIISSYCKY